MKWQQPAFRKLKFSIIAACLTLFFQHSTTAATVYTSNVTTGNWSSSGSWTVNGSGTPVKYIVKAGHTITLDISVSGIDTLYIYGTLYLNSNLHLNMTLTGAIIFNNTGVLEGGSNNTEIYYGTPGATKIIGPFTSTNIIDGGPRYGNYSTMMAAGGNPQGSFPITLPVLIRSSEVSQENNEFVLTWVSTGLANLNDFIITTSTNGKNYSTVGTVKGTKNPGDETYEYNLGTLKQSTYVSVKEAYSGDTQFMFSEFIAIEKSTQNKFSIHPSEINSSTTSLRLVFPESGNYKFRVFNTSMQAVYQMDIQTTTDNQVLNVNPGNLTNCPGLYISVISSDNGSLFKQKIIVE